MSSATIESILYMPDIESFPDNELLWLMNLCAHADGVRTCRPLAFRLAEYRKRRCEGFSGVQGTLLKSKFEPCWFDDRDAFEGELAKYARMFRRTYYTVNLSIGRYGPTGGLKSPVKVEVNSVWHGCPFMLSRVLNLVITVDSLQDMGEWVMIREAVEGQIATLPALERLVVVEYVAPDGPVSEEMSRFLVFALRDVIKARGLNLEVHCLVGPRPAAKKWSG